MHACMPAWAPRRRPARSGIYGCIRASNGPAGVHYSTPFTDHVPLCSRHSQAYFIEIESEMVGGAHGRTARSNVSLSASLSLSRSLYFGTALHQPVSVRFVQHTEKSLRQCKTCSRFCGVERGPTTSVQAERSDHAVPKVSPAKCTSESRENCRPE